jgi:hypothetical protein
LLIIIFFQLTAFSDKFGAGYYNLSVAAEFRFQRIQDSIATNPQFSFISPRYFTAYAESVFPIAFFIDGRDSSGQLDMNVARGFFQDSRFPDGFFRPNLSGTRTSSETVSILSPLSIPFPQAATMAHSTATRPTQTLPI